MKRAGALADCGFDHHHVARHPESAFQYMEQAQVPDFVECAARNFSGMSGVKSGVRL
jgi:hypothetical protein